MADPAASGTTTTGCDEQPDTQQENTKSCDDNDNDDSNDRQEQQVKEPATKKAKADEDVVVETDSSNQPQQQQQQQVPAVAGSQPENIERSEQDADEEVNNNTNDNDDSEEGDSSSDSDDDHPQRLPGRGITIDLGDMGDDDDDDSAQAAYLNRLLEAAANGGIDIEYLMAEAQEAQNPTTDYPFERLPTNLLQVAEFIRSDQCRKILILAGAGMSVSAGIPDFRSADGLYATLDPDKLSASSAERQMMRLDPSSSLDQSLFLENPLPMLELQREFILGTHQQRWKATLAHRFVELLHRKTGKLARLYTQNIDGLEDQTSLPPDKVIGVHGSMDRAECARCHSPADFPAFCHSVATQIKDLSGRDPRAPAESTAVECRVCGYGAVKPGIVLFKSSLPRIFFESVPTDVEDVDLLLVIGTSLRVAPANSLVWRIPRTALRVLVNREPAGFHVGMRGPAEDPSRDFFALGDCDDVFLELMEHLGWLDDLQQLLKTKDGADHDESNDRLPPLCREKLDARLAAISANIEDKAAATEQTSA